MPEDVSVDEHESTGELSGRWKLILLGTAVAGALFAVIVVVLLLNNPLQSECGGFSCDAGSSVSNAPSP
jgi:hypothetical protein